MKNLAIIPARSGSKGLKNKNIKLLNGKPLLVYSIEAAKESELFDEIHVSTDSVEYARISKESGGNVPFLRSEMHSADESSTWDVVKEVLKNYQKIGKTFDVVTILQPTAPLRKAVDIKNAFSILQKDKANAVIGVCEVEHSPLWCNTLPENHSLCKFMKNVNSDIPRQKLDTFYRINGAIYMVKTDYLNQCKSIYDSACIAYIMSKENSVDIDDKFDFIVAEAMMKALVY